MAWLTLAIVAAIAGWLQPELLDPASWGDWLSDPGPLAWAALLALQADPVTSARDPIELHAQAQVQAILATRHGRVHAEGIEHVLRVLRELLRPGAERGDDGGAAVD